MGCLSSVLIWLCATVALFWFGSGAPAETVATVIGAGVGACFCVQSVLWLTTRARQARLVARYSRLYGPVPGEAPVVGTRAGGTIGRLLGGSTGYLIGGLAGAAADVRAQAKAHEQMSEAQRRLLQEIRRVSLVSPVLSSTFMVGALLASWVLVVVYEMARVILSA